jgi:hypothetical protein
MSLPSAYNLNSLFLSSSTYFSSTSEFLNSNFSLKKLST